MHNIEKSKVIKQPVVQSFFGKEIQDDYSYLESANEYSKTFTETQNEISNKYFSNNKYYEGYKSNLTELANNKLSLITERNNLLYAMLVDNEDRRFIISTDDEFKTQNVVLKENDVDDEKIESYSLSPDGLYVSVITKNLWSVHHKAYIYNVNTLSLIHCFDKCNQIIYGDKDRIYIQINADLNDEADINKVLEANLNNNCIDNIKVIFEISEMYNMEIVLSEDRQFIFLNILMDYYENDCIYYKKADDRDFIEIVSGDRGRYSYIGSSEKQHFFQTNNCSPNYKIVAVPINDVNIENAVEIVMETKNLHAAKSKRSAYKVGSKIIIFEIAQRGKAVNVVDLNTGEKRYILYENEGVYFNNLYNVSIENREFIYFTYESIISNISVYKLNTASLEIKKIYCQKEVSNVEIRDLVYNEKIIKVVDKHYNKNCKAILTFNYGYDNDLAFNNNNFNIKTPVIEWVESGNIFIEYRLSQYKADDLEALFDEIDELIDFLVDKNVVNKNQIGLLDGGYSYSIAQMYCVKRPGKIRALCTVGGRTDLINYVNDASSYMFKEMLGDAYSNRESFDNLINYSPYHNVKSNVTYPAHLFLCNDYSLLVPSYHSKKMVAIMQEYNTSKVNLLKCFVNEDFTEMIIDMFAFFDKELERGADGEISS